MFLQQKFKHVHPGLYKMTIPSCYQIFSNECQKTKLFKIKMYSQPVLRGHLWDKEKEAL